MKYIYTLSFIAITFCTSYSQHDYIPYIGENKYWVYNQDNGADANPPSIGAFIISFGSDTLINGLNYTKLIKHVLPGNHPCQSGPCFRPFIPYQINTNYQVPLAYLREDTLLKKVYCLPAAEFITFCDTAEHVLYDFDQKIGDTLSLCNLKIIGGGIFQFFMIDSITNEFQYGKLRKVLYFKGLFGGGGMPGLRTLRLIEGIGLDKHFGLYNDYTVTFTTFCEGTLEQCNIVSSTKDEKESSLNQLTLFPNPVVDNLTIQSDLDYKEIGVIDQNGRTVLSGNSKEINVSALPSGLYYLKLITTQNKVYYRKVVKM